MAVHITCVKELVAMPIGGAGHVAQVPNLETATVLEFDIAAAAVAIPAGTVALGISETAGTAFRYAIGGSGVTVPDAPNAHRWTSTMGHVFVGVRGGNYIRTAAA